MSDSDMGQPPSTLPLMASPSKAQIALEVRAAFQGVKRALVFPDRRYP